MNTSDNRIFGYSYGAADLLPSALSLADLESLKLSVGFTREDEAFLKLAGDVLAEQTGQIVGHWRAGIIASIPHLARHSRNESGEALPEYLASSNRRFQQWILDTCLKTYDQDWLNYQQEIALRHTTRKKNIVDGVQSTAYVPMRDVIAFAAVMNQTIKPYLGNKGHLPEVVEGMHQAWCKSIQLQLAIWTKTYMDIAATGSNEW